MSTSKSRDPEFRFSENHASDDAVKHIYVRDVTGTAHTEEPLSPFMVPSKYLTPQQGSGKKLPPKKPLGSRSRQPVKMYSQIAAPAAMGRVRRPRMTIPVESVSSKRDEAVLKMRQLGMRAKVIAAAALAFLGGGLVAAKEFLHDLSSKFHISTGRVKYSAFQGAAIKKFGMPATWFRVVAPAALLLFLLGLGIFNGLFGTNGNDTNIPEGGRGGGNAVIEVRDSSNNGTGTANAPVQGSATDSQANNTGGQVQGSPSDSIQSTSPASGSALPLGGRGSGATAPTYYTAPAPTTATGTVAPTQPAPTGSGGGDTDTSGGGGGILPAPSLPLPTVEPSTDCLCETLSEPVNTLNTTTDGATNTLTDTTQGTTNTIGL